MSTKTNILVLLAAYNGQLYLEEQILSIVNQRYVNVTILISVDFSIDNSFSICHELSKKFQNISLLPYGESFGSAAKNFYRLVTDSEIEGFDYIALSDQDDIWDPYKLCFALQVLNSSCYDCYSSNLLAFFPDGSEVMIEKSDAQTPVDYLYQSASAGCTYVLSNRFVSALKIFFEAQPICFFINSHDWLFYAFARFSKFKWVFDNRSFIKYRQHDCNVAGANIGIKGLFKRINPLFSGWYQHDQKLIVDLFGSDNGFFRIYKYGVFKQRRNPFHSFIIAFLVLFNILK